MQILLNHQRRLLYSRAGAKGTLEAIGASRAGNRDGVRPATVLYGCCRKQQAMLPTVILTTE
jgi:hypothetical protein